MFFLVYHHLVIIYISCVLPNKMFSCKPVDVFLLPSSQPQSEDGSEAEIGLQCRVTHACPEGGERQIATSRRHAGPPEFHTAR